MVSGSPTQQIASAATAATSIAATDILDASEVRKAVRTLKKNKALQLKGTKNSMVFGGIVGPEGSYDLGIQTWRSLNLANSVDISLLRQYRAKPQIGEGVETMYETLFFDSDDIVRTTQRCVELGRNALTVH